MKKHITTSVLVLLLCGAKAQNYNAGPVHVNGDVYDASTLSGSYLATSSNLLVGSGGTWLLNNAQFTTPRISTSQTEVVKFSGGTYSRTTGYINGYTAADNQAAGFTLPIGHSNYRPLTVNMALAAGNTLTAAWYDQRPLAYTHIDGVVYNFLPGYYDVNATDAGIIVTPTSPAEATADTRLVGTADGVHFVDLASASAAIALPAGTYQLRFANAGIILPLTLTAFTASRQGNAGMLSWEITSEQNVHSYTVQRSADGRNFAAIGSLPSMGNTTQERMYTLRDATPLQGANYYRLKVIEGDGKVSYSAVRLLNFDAVVRIAVYPNPVSEKATVTGLEAGMKVTLFSLQGQHMSSQKASGNTLAIELKRLPAGIYEVLVQDANGMAKGRYRIVKD